MHNLVVYLEDNPADKLFCLQIVATFHFRFGMECEVCVPGYKPPQLQRAAVTGTAKVVNVDMNSDFIKSLGPMQKTQMLGRSNLPGGSGED